MLGSPDRGAGELRMVGREGKAGCQEVSVLRNAKTPRASPPTAPPCPFRRSILSQTPPLPTRPSYQPRFVAVELDESQVVSVPKALRWRRGAERFGSGGIGASRRILWRRDARFLFLNPPGGTRLMGARQAKTPRPLVLLGLECGPAYPHPRVPRLRTSVLSHASWPL
ncbi:hypothetical protein L1887_48837 [Cichorium endivia]|nr:hypothetical protein L1887_48837 [Cichorium endivia]